MNDQTTLATDDNRGLHCRHFGPKEARQVIVIVHGLGEHSGCYEEFGQRMAETGIATFAYDQHGHGKSPGRRGDAPSFDLLVDDISLALSEARDRHPHAELVLLGHSMGGNLVLNHLLDRDCDLADRAMVTNPMILPPDPPTKPQAFAAWLTAKIIPHLRVSASIEPTDLTQDPDALQSLAADPLLHEQLSIGIGGELLSHGHWLLEHAGKLQRPLLLLTGSDDELCDRESTKEFARLAGPQCKHVDFDGLRHCLLIEKDRDQVYDVILDWV
ncbi:MAG: alpha/beta hydrolase [Pirellulaceae bacterium]|nr:alpha/beta hydrolase [Pirellulaceae bacterium]